MDVKKLLRDKNFKFEKEDDVCYKYYYDYKNNESKKIEYECGQI